MCVNYMYIIFHSDSNIELDLKLMSSIAFIDIIYQHNDTDVIADVERKKERKMPEAMEK